MFIGAFWSAVLFHFQAQVGLRFLRVLPTMILDSAGGAMGLEIRPAQAHQVPFMELVEKDKFPFPGREVVIQPDFVLGDKVRIDQVMPALREVDEVEAPDKSALNNPNLDGAAVFLEELFVDIFDGFPIGEFGYLSYQFGLAAFLQLDGIGFLQGLVIGHALGHHSILDKQMINEKLLFAQAVLLVDPEFVHRNESEAEVLAEVRELLVDSAPDILAIHDPNCDVRDLVEFLDVRFLHDSRPLIF
jgi:hypothetical protein